ncbi:hypothetical protein MTO96_008296 [Rhipicephalus appendiculatus]
MAAAYLASKQHSDRERWVCIYPAYINSKKTLAEGRRLPKSQCVENPTYQEIRDVLDATGFKVGVENKLYPGNKTRTYPTRKALMHHICDMIPRLKTRTQRQGGADQQAQGSANASKKGGKGGKGAKGKR